MRAKVKGRSRGSVGDDGTLLDTPLRRIAIPAHKEVLEARPVTEDAPPPPAPDQMPRSNHRQEYSNMDDSEVDSYYDLTEDEMSAEEDLPSIPGDLASRFPRHLKFAGLSQTELRRALKASGSNMSGLFTGSSSSSSSAASSKDCSFMHSRLDSAGGPALDLPGSWAQWAHSCRVRKHKLSLQQEMRCRACQEAVRRLSMCGNETLHFTGISARLYQGLPAWVATYETAAHGGGEEFTLEITIMRGTPGAAATAAQTSSSSSSSSSCCRPSSAESTGHASSGFAGSAVIFELRAHAWLPSGSKQLTRGVRERVRFYFSGDSDCPGKVQPHRHPPVLRGTAATLDLLFRAPTSLPSLSMRAPRLETTTLTFGVDKKFQESIEHHGEKLTAGLVYHAVERSLASSQDSLPPILYITAGEGSAHLSGVFKHALPGVVAAPDLSPTDGHGPGAPPHDRHCPPERHCHRQSGNLHLRSPTVRLQDVRFQGYLTPGRENFEDHDSAGSGSDGERSVGGRNQRGDQWDPSEDELEGDFEDDEQWDFYYCEETGKAIIPLIWTEIDDLDFEDAEDMKKTGARWVFVDLPSRPRHGQGGCESSSVTIMELQQSLSQPIAWVDIPGREPICQTFEAAVVQWVPLPAATIKPVWADDDHVTREVLVPEKPICYTGPAGRPPGENFWEVRCPLLCSSFGLRKPVVKVFHAWWFSRITKALPINRWIHHKQLMSSAILKHLDLPLVLRRPRSFVRQTGRYMSVPGPDHIEELLKVPVATAEWMQFGSDGLREAVEQVQELCAQDRRAGYCDSFWARQGGQGDHLALVVEIRRTKARVLDFRICAKPGLLLLALLSPWMQPPHDISSVELNFEWRIEDRKASSQQAETEEVGQQLPQPSTMSSRSTSQPPLPSFSSSTVQAGSAASASSSSSSGLYSSRTATNRKSRFALLSNCEDQQHPQPPRFRAFPLRPEQLRTLQWMRTSELSDEPFIFEHEAVEDVSQFHPSWKLRGRLRCAVKVRGGILADKVGYGKTATTIGLIEATRDEAAPPPPGDMAILGPRVVSRATLVLVPANLHAQWLSEVRKFVCGTLKVVSLQTYAQLKRVSTQDLQDADLVVATYQLFHSPKYLARLKELALEADASLRPDISGLAAGRSRRGPAHAVGRGGASKARRAGMSSFRGDREPDSQPLTLSWPPTDTPNHIDWNLPTFERKRQRLQSFQKNYNRTLAMFEAVGARSASSSSASKRTGEEASLGISRPSKRMCRKGPLLEAKPSDSPRAAPESAPVRVAMPDRPAVPPQRSARAATKCLGELLHPRARRSANPSTGFWRPPKIAPPLELIYWKRLVFDEFHELFLKHNPAQVPVQRLKAAYRWGLSGTPPCCTTSEVMRTASFFHCPIGGFQGQDASREICQKWLDHCVRQNTSGLPELHSHEDIVLVRQHPAERALYLQLAQAASDADLAGEEDASVLVALRRRGQEGLVKMCSHFQLSGAQLQRSAIDECDAVLQQRLKELEKARQALSSLLMTAWKLALELGPLHGVVEGIADPDSLLEELQNEALAAKAEASQAQAVATSTPTEAAQRHITSCLVEASSTIVPEQAAAQGPWLQRLRQAKVPSFHQPSDTSESTAWEEYQQALAKWRQTRAGMSLRKDAEEAHKKAVKAVTDARRGLRSLEARARLVQFFQATLRVARAEEPTKCPICFEDVDIEERCILPCAHIGCVNCFGEVARRDGRCPVCRCDIGPRQVMRLQAQGDICQSEPKECGRHGSKIARLLTFLKDLEDKEPDAKVILFVQWEDLKKKVANALRESGVEHASLGGSIWSRQRTIERFQNGPICDSGRVLLLSSQDSASGTNLTRASHVILFHPMISSTRQASVACEMQAIGRALRAGQPRPVRIWRFVVAGTVEQRITEEHQHSLWERFRAAGLRAGGEASAPALSATAAEDAKEELIDDEGSAPAIRSSHTAWRSSTSRSSPSASNS